MTPALEPTLAAILDEIVPASTNGRLPGAGALGVAEHVVAAIAKQPELALTIEPGCEAAETLARERHGRAFAELSSPQRLDVLHTLEATHPALVPTLTFHGYVGYYQHPRVVGALGLPARPPHPQGYEMAPGDLSLIDAVRRRGAVYRDA